MNLQRLHLSLDPRAVRHLTLLAEEEQTTLVDLIRDVLDQHLLETSATGGPKAGSMPSPVRPSPIRCNRSGPRSSPHCGPGSECPRRPAGTRLSAVWFSLHGRSWRRPRPPMMRCPFDRDLQAPRSSPAGHRSWSRGHGPHGTVPDAADTSRSAPPEAR